MSDEIAYARIHPAIGIARVGNSTRPDGWFYGPEVPDPPAEAPGFYKDDQGAIKRQAARFRIYGYDAAGRAVRELGPADPHTDIEWQVHLANTKAAWYEFRLPNDIPDMKDHPVPLRNAKTADRATLIVDPGRKAVNAADRNPVEFTGGSFLGAPVPLGAMHTDEAGRLVVLGGAGTSRNPDGDNLVSFGNNDGWCDDTADGPVTATVSIGGRQLRVDPAWVVVAPPNFAPDLKTLRTLHDELVDVFTRAGTLPPIKRVSFARDIEPILRRFCELQWVNKGFATNFGFGGPQHFLDPAALARLGSTADRDQELRRQVYTTLRDYQRDGLSPVPWPWFYGDGMSSRPSSPLQYLTLSSTQQDLLLSWMNGDFDAGNGAADGPARLADAPVTDQPDLLDRAALDFCLADAFHPGCEVTWPIRHPTMYSEPLRIRHRPDGSPGPEYGPTLSQAQVLAADGPLHEQGPGDLTRWMAVPWQTDTVSCRSGYESNSGLGPRYDPYLPTFWPARVPNHVLTERDYRTVNKETGRPTETERDDAFANRASWLRGLHGTPTDQFAQGVAEWYKFGIVEVRPYTVGDGRFPDRLQVESTPGFPLAGVSDTANLVAIHVDAATAAEDSAVLAAASDILSLTGLAPEEVTVGYFDKVDPFGLDRGAPAGSVTGLRYDAVVAGGGPAGAAAALALAARGRTVLLVHAPGGPPPVGEALPAAARLLLHDLGAADTVPGDGHLPCHANRSAWGSPRLHSTESIHDPCGPGWHLDRALFDRRLREAAARRGAEPVEGTARAVRRAGEWELTIRQSDGQSTHVHSSWLVDATGRRAALATRHGARRQVHDRLVALHLTLEPGPAGAARDGATLVEAAPDGWWYSALLPGGRLLVAFCTDADLPAARNADFQHRLAATGPTAARAAGYRAPSHPLPQRAPASSAQLDTVYGDGWIAAGDAAAAFDPLSSQGILTALHTGQAAGLAVHAHLAGDPAALPRYAAQLAAVTTAHQRNRAAYYGVEQRWPEQPFWARRHRVTAPLRATAPLREAWVLAAGAVAAAPSG